MIVFKIGYTNQHLLKKQYSKLTSDFILVQQFMSKFSFYFFYTHISQKVTKIKIIQQFIFQRQIFKFKVLNQHCVAGELKNKRKCIKSGRAVVDIINSQPLDLHEKPFQENLHNVSCKDHKISLKKLSKTILQFQQRTRPQH